MKTTDLQKQIAVARDLLKLAFHHADCFGSSIDPHRIRALLKASVAATESCTLLVKMSEEYNNPQPPAPVETKLNTVPLG